MPDDKSNSKSDTELDINFSVRLKNTPMVRQGIPITVVESLDIESSDETLPVSSDEAIKATLSKRKDVFGKTLRKVNDATSEENM
jgi:hypothetical protein